MKFPALLLFFLLSLNRAISQTDSTVYSGLGIRKWHSVNLLSFGTDVYKVNGIEVDAQVFKKYEKEREIMASCCPCILRSYNEKEVLVKEAVMCSDCGVGYYKEFYPSGRLKVKGQYKENPTGNWRDIWRRGYCSKPTGKWFYYEERDTNYHIKHTEEWDNGKPIGTWLYYNYNPKDKANNIIRIEKWDNGEFVEQRPEGTTAEIWSASLILEGIEIDSQTISINDALNTSIILKYKNKSRNIALMVEISAHANSTPGGVLKKHIATNPNEISIREAITDIEFQKIVEHSKKEDFHFSITLFENGKYLTTFHPKIKP